MGRNFKGFFKGEGGSARGSTFVRRAGAGGLLKKSPFRRQISLFLARAPCMVRKCARRGAARTEDSRRKAMATKKAAGGGGGAKKTLSKSGLIQAITEAV